MNSVRRVYLYLVAAASLGVLAVGTVLLAQALVLDLTGSGAQVVSGGLRRQVAEGASAAVVGLPVWLLHWTLANRAAAERSALLRRLFLYVVLAVTAVTGWLALDELLSALFRLIVAGTPERGITPVLLPMPVVGVAAVLWWYHRRVGTQDRAAVGEIGGGATLRRWYRYGVALVTLIALLGGVGRLVSLSWELIVAGSSGTTITGGPVELAAVAASTLAALTVWLPHWWEWAVAPRAQRQEIVTQDARSTLRPVYLFVALALSVSMTLVAAWQMVFYALGRILGESQPGGVGGNLLFALAGPAGLLLAFGVSWLYQRRALALQAQAQSELPRQAGVRRLYVYLVSLIALSVLAAGVGGLLWTLSDLATNAPHPADAPGWWRDRVSLYVALAIVGLPVWVTYWHPVANATAGGSSTGRAPGEAGSLARRLYMYLPLLAGVLALLGAGVAAVKQVFDLALGEAATPGVITNLARALSVAAIAALVVFYHQRVLRTDAQRTQAEARTEARAQESAPATPQFGVIARRAHGTETSAWFATNEEGLRAYQIRRAQPEPTAWVALVKVEQAEAASPSESGLAGPRPPALPRAA